MYQRATLRWQANRCDMVISRFGERRLVGVTATSPIAQRRRAERVARFVADSGGFGVSFYAVHPSDTTLRHAFVLIEGQRAVGYALFEVVGYTRATTWAELDALTPGQSLPLLPVKQWALGPIWVAPEQRRQGIASWLIQTASASIGVALDELAWAGPFSDGGERLARRLCAEQIIVA
jgi:GNAT superfamily N-acetyltransferase